MSSKRRTFQKRVKNQLQIFHTFGLQILLSLLLESSINTFESKPIQQETYIIMLGKKMFVKTINHL